LKTSCFLNPLAVNPLHQSKNIIVFTPIQRGMKEMKSGVPQQTIEGTIFMVRGQKVMLSTHLAQLYDVEPKVLMQAVKRNIDRFPEDFMFQLSVSEFDNLKSQFVTSSWGGMRRSRPYAFTEQGVAMLSSVLRSKRAVLVNIEIMRVFVRLREMLATHKELASKFEKLEKRIDVHDEQFQLVFEAIKALMKEEEKPKHRIGFQVEESKAEYRGKRSLK
jgi:hypothetical protein